MQSGLLARVGALGLEGWELSKRVDQDQIGSPGCGIDVSVVLGETVCLWDGEALQGLIGIILE